MVEGDYEDHVKAYYYVWHSKNRKGKIWRPKLHRREIIKMDCQERKIDYGCILVERVSAWHN